MPGGRSGGRLPTLTWKAPRTAANRDPRGFSSAGGIRSSGSTPRLRADRSTSLTLAVTVPAQVLPNSLKLQSRPATPRPTCRCRTSDRRPSAGVPPESIASET